VEIKKVYLPNRKETVFLNPLLVRLQQKNIVYERDIYYNVSMFHLAQYENVKELSFTNPVFREESVWLTKITAAYFKLPNLS